MLKQQVKMKIKTLLNYNTLFIHHFFIHFFDFDFYFSLSNITSSIKGNTEKSLKKIFWEAEKNCPSIIFIDELDSIAPNKENNIKEFDKKNASQLLICIDEIRLVKNKPVVILAATNDPENIDPLLRRPGRFDKEINPTLPDYENRIHILNHFCK